MKEYFVLFVSLVVLSFAGQAQSRSDKMYDALSELDGITSLSFSKNMIDALNINVGDEGDERKVTGDLHQVRFMSYNPEKGSMSGHEFLKKAVSYLPKSDYRKYEEKGSGDNDAEIWLMGSGKKYRECHVFFKNENSEGLQFVVSFFGDFRVGDLERLKKAGKDFSED